jgi:hypothetical protein
MPLYAVGCSIFLNEEVSSVPSEIVVCNNC